MQIRSRPNRRRLRKRAFERSAICWRLGERRFLSPRQFSRVLAEETGQLAPSRYQGLHQCRRGEESDWFESFASATPLRYSARGALQRPYRDLCRQREEQRAATSVAYEQPCRVLHY
jgi:hypothetical protein